VQKTSTVAEKANTSNKPNKIDWDRVRKISGLIRRARGEVINQHKRPRTFRLPKKPGIQLLGYGDYLIRAGFTRIYSEEEMEELEALRVLRF